MFDKHKVVVVTPAGRRRYLELLIPQILKLRPIVDKYVLWVNTVDLEDIEYMKSVASTYPDFITLEFLTIPHNGTVSIHSFFKNCTDPNTVYVRFDDDIVMIDDNDAFSRFVEFRIKNPKYFLVYGNILNNAVLSHIHQRIGNLSNANELVGYNSMDAIGWKSGEFAEKVHRQILKCDSLEKFRFEEKWILHYYERVSINCISWLGETFSEFNGIVGEDEEVWLSIDKPKDIKSPNCIFGGFVCVHYAFFVQREHIDKTDILKMYKSKISEV